MLYKKNLPQWERWVRVVVGIVLAVYAFVGVESAITLSILLVTGLVVTITGFYGYCPMCAIAGRKLKDPKEIGR